MTNFWKIIGSDDYGRDNVADILIAETIKDEIDAIVMAAAMNKAYPHSGYYYSAVPQDQQLSRGMEDLV